MKINYKKICLLLVILMISCLALGSVEAAVTSATGTVVEDNSGTFGSIINEVMKVVGWIGSTAASGVFATITSLINALSITLLITLYTLVSAGTGDYTHLPFPDVVVFNRFAFFDPNFVNPSKYSLVEKFGTTLSNLFASFQTVAIAVFVIAAMVAGIRMALSSIAAKKAQYKEAALKWVSGFLVLVCLKWILAAIFYTNEYLVATLYGISKADDLLISFKFYEMIPIFGRAIEALVKLFNAEGDFLAVELPGYIGIFASNLAKATGGNIIASIVGFIIIGQTLTVIGSYLKRVFMCMLLGIISPLIVAADTVMAVMGKQSTIFKSWLQNFCLTVFMQTIHAMYMVVAFQMIASVYKNIGTSADEFTSEQAAIVTIVLTTGLVKLEKLIKSLFGIGDSFSGDLKSGAKGMVQAMGAVRGIAAGAKAIGDNAGKARDATKRKQAYSKELSNLKGQAARDKAASAFDAAKKAKAEGNMDEYRRQRQIAADALKDAKQNGYQFDPKAGFGVGVVQSSDGTGGKGNGNGDYLQQVLNGSGNLTREEKIRKLEEGIASATADYKSATFASIMAPANLAAGIGLGLGMGDDISEALFKGGHITAALDRGAETVGKVAADKDRKTFAASEQEYGDKYGYRPSERIIREKTLVEKTLEKAVHPTDSNGNSAPLQSIAINPIAVGKEIAKQFSGINDVLSDTMKKELRRMDKNLDDSQ